MQLSIYQYTSKNGWDNQPDVTLDSSNTLILIFAASSVECLKPALLDLETWFPQSKSIGCSSAGEIYNDEIFDETLSVAILCFEKSSIQQLTIPILPNDSSLVGKTISLKLKTEGLKAVFVLSEGIHVNGSELVKDIQDNLPEGVVISGGLAGDGNQFKQTWVLSDYEIQQDVVSIIAFYGDQLCIGHGSKGGWDVLGIDRLVTSSKHNILYELDGKPALALYKEYLGDRAKDLPASGLLFPLAIQNENTSDGDTVRTILAINEEDQSIIFAGDIPKGSTVRLMHANFDRIVDAAYTAAESLLTTSNCSSQQLVIAISCVGRRLVLGQRCEEEVEATLEVLPPKTHQIGFYSYGEISPLASGDCGLHNQTMTLTMLGEL